MYATEAVQGSRGRSWDEEELQRQLFVNHWFPSQNINRDATQRQPPLLTPSHSLHGMASSKVFSIHGKGLKLDTKADIQPHLDQLKSIVDVEEVHLGGNTFGVEACEGLAEVLKGSKTLKVLPPSFPLCH